MQLSPVCPEVPVAKLGAALACYRDQLGFTVDWSDEELGLAGLSRGETRIFRAARLITDLTSVPKDQLCCG